MNKILIVGVICGLVLGITFSPKITDAIYSIPPTPAFRVINSSSLNVTASSYNDYVEFVAGTGMTISPNFANNKITFTSTGGGGGGGGGGQNTNSSWTYLIFKTDAESSGNQTYYLLDGRTRQVIQTETYPDPIFGNSTLKKGDVFVQDGVYRVRSVFPGITLPINTNFVMSFNTFILVPNGFAGSVFNLNNGISHTKISGGRISEDGTPLGLWTAIKLTGGSTGVFANTIENMRIWFPKNGIYFTAPDNGWINANVFRDIEIFNHTNAINFNFTGTYTPNTAEGFNRNLFENIIIQQTTSADYGVRGVLGRANYFNQVHIFDSISPTISTTISGQAYNTTIIGGVMTDKNFVDSGQYTRILDYGKLILKGIDLSNSTNTFGPWEKMSNVTDGGCAVGQVRTVSAGGQWSCATISSGATTLESLTNVTDSGCTTGEIRVVSGTNWVCNKSIYDSTWDVGEVKTVVKTSDETVNNSAVMQDDNELFIAVQPTASRYLIKVFFVFDSSAVADIRDTITVPGLLTGTPFEDPGITSTTTGTYGTAIFQDGTASGTLKGMVLYGTLSTDGTAGNILFRFAQSTAEATNTIVKAGAVMEVTRVA